MVRRCHRIAVPGGGVAFVTVDVRRKRCEDCRGWDFDLVLCDWPVQGDLFGEPKTCDRQVCKRCATRIGPDRDLCRRHARLRAAAAIWDR